MSVSKRDLKTLKMALSKFAAERDWDKFHFPKNLAMALIGETAEIIEHFQWLNEAESKRLSAAKKREIQEELGDTLIYLVRLADNHMQVYPQSFRVTTRLAFEEARTLDELSLVREPEQRLYRELVAAGLRVQLREDRPSGQPAYDIADLRLRFDVFDANEQKVRISFDPAKGAFFGENQEWFRFEDLMFDAERCMQRIRDGFSGALKPG